MFRVSVVPVGQFRKLLTFLRVLAFLRVITVPIGKREQRVLVLYLPQTMGLSEKYQKNRLRHSHCADTRNVPAVQCPPTTMRFSLWLFLILAFSVGMCCALAIRYFYFEATPVAVRTFEPTTKILVAKRTIPNGVEITADFVVFQEVPISEVPKGSLISFAQVYRRQPAYPIPAGCPVCEDLLLPQAATTVQTAFIPTGNQIVALDVVHVRHGDKVFLPKKPLSTVLSADQYIDIRVVPPESQGQLAEKKNALLRTFGSQDIRNSGELILEKVPIYRIQRQIVADHTGLIKDSLELMLGKSEAARLATAAKRGQIRILVYQGETNNTTDSPFGVADSSVPLPDTLVLEQSWSLDTPYTQEHFLPIPAERELAVPGEHSPRVAPEPVASASVPALTMLPFLGAEEVSPNLNQQPESPAASNAPELFAKEMDIIRNDGNEGMVAFGTVPFRNIASESLPIVERTPVTEKLPFQTNTSKQETFIRSHSTDLQEMTMGVPRVTSRLQFLPLGGIAPVKEYSQAMTWQAEPEILPLVMPSATPVPMALQGMPEYSPFDRRIYTVLPVDDPDSRPNEELPAPQRLLRSSDAGTQTK